jgi:hypothetical protein
LGTKDDDIKSQNARQSHDPVIINKQSKLKKGINRKDTENNYKYIVSSTQELQAPCFGAEVCSCCCAKEGLGRGCNVFPEVDFPLPSILPSYLKFKLHLPKDFNEKVFC